MCGLAGVFAADQQPIDRGILLRMTRAITHRGPDGEGVYVDGSIGLGHRRLAIVDLSPSGHQPMTTADKRFTLVYNGEVYNHPELRTELEARGRRFKSRSDSEVILEAWAEWGPDAVRRFNGMFAFAIWDALAKELTLARDKYGIKPLYYAKTSNLLVFGSEQRALLQHPVVGRRLDKFALVEYLTFQNILTERTFNQDIKILPAGHLLKAKTNSSIATLTQYWDFRFEESTIVTSQRDLEDELESLIRQAVRRQLRSDVEVGSYLSGGLDSGTIATLAAAENPALKTFTCGFDMRDVIGAESHFDERRAAQVLADQLGTIHTEIVIGETEMVASLDAVVEHLEEPRVGQSYPNFLVAALAANSVKVVMSGAGGDELFAGYPWRYAGALHNTDEVRFRDQYFQFWNRLIPRAELPHVLAPIWSEVKDYDPREVFDSVISRHQGSDTGEIGFLNDCLYFEAKTFLHGLLVVEDKLSMAHSLETRLPFLDDDLVTFAMKCPVASKIESSDRVEGSVSVASRASASLDGKKILRTVLQRIAGSAAVARPKQGFSAPDTNWINSEIARRASDTPLRTRTELFLRESAIHDLLTGRNIDARKRRILLWSLVVIDNVIGQFEP